jgi:hypothetical protein
VLIPLYAVIFLTFTQDIEDRIVYDPFEIVYDPFKIIYGPIIDFGFSILALSLSYGFVAWEPTLEFLFYCNPLF